MKLSVKPGKYLVAVSGGVDSVVLLHLLASRPDLDLVVAHFDHGIRPDSTQDADFVADVARQHDLPFVSERAELGPSASEAVARQARYDFLHRVQQRSDAQAIITAHHQDDVLETAIFNIIRGTGRRGLTSLQSTPQLLRPLLGAPKTDILDYAAQHHLKWREDSTNYDQRYTRNYIRHRLLIRFDAGARQQLLALISQLQMLNAEIDQLLAVLLAERGESLPRTWFSGLPYDVSKEVMAAFLRQNQLAGYDKKGLERLVEQAKTKPTGKQFDVFSGHRLLITRTQLTLTK